MSSLESDTTVIENFIQGKLWAEKRSKYSYNDIVIPYFLAGDDVEVNNPLSSHSSKVMPIYASFPCLPPECRSQLTNILLVLIYDSWIRDSNKKNRTYDIYRPLIQGIKYLEKNGIEINTSTGKKKIYFVLGLIQRDKLGLHGLLGFTESFAATHYCRFCKMKKNDCKNALIIPCELKRNNVNYEQDCLANNISITGIKEKCVFNGIESFHCTKNYSVDEMHDVREGIAHDDLIAILRKLTFEKSDCYSFPLSELNDRLTMYDYGPIDCSNKPPLIREEDIKNESKLKMTASELTTFVKLFGILIKDLVDKSNPCWDLYVLLPEIFDFTLAKKVTKEQILGFESVIRRHHLLYIELTGKNLKPKHHFLLHYPEVCEQSGPISHVSSIRSESKHTHLTGSASVNRCRINIPLSVAKKHQLMMNFLTISDKCLMPTIIFGPISPLELNLFDYCNLPNVLRDRNISVTKWVEFKNIKYTPKMLVLVRYENLMPVFAEIDAIVTVNDNVNNVYLLCNYLIVLGYHEHVVGYEVMRSNSVVWINIEDLRNIFSLFVHTSLDDELYVILNYTKY
ncbi:GSCOCG00011773001-RA-CDS [Cotesia congregata]|nr:GSCOCG00011773001-RA-CDS [Cotesia congregata]